MINPRSIKIQQEYTLTQWEIDLWESWEERDRQRGYSDISPEAWKEIEDKHFPKSIKIQPKSKPLTKWERDFKITTPPIPTEEIAQIDEFLKSLDPKPVKKRKKTAQGKQLTEHS